MKKPILPLKDFQRIFQTIHGVVLSEGLDALTSCYFFAITGSEILKSHYKLKAIPVAGSVVYNLDNLNEVVIAFTNEFHSNSPIVEKPHHCWVQVEGWFIDFTSPLFPEILNSGGLDHTCRRKMFQKPLTEASGSISELDTTGSFYYQSDPFLSSEAIGVSSSNQVCVDLQQICVSWYKRPPKKMIETIRIRNGEGHIKSASRTPIQIEGAW